jgi:hypothetical protein
MSQGVIDQDIYVLLTEVGGVHKLLALGVTQLLLPTCTRLVAT